MASMAGVMGFLPNWRTTPLSQACAADDPLRGRDFHSGSDSVRRQSPIAGRACTSESHRVGRDRNRYGARAVLIDECYRRADSVWHVCVGIYRKCAGGCIRAGVQDMFS